MNTHTEIEITEERDDLINGKSFFQLSSNNSAGSLAVQFVVHNLLQFPGHLKGV